MSKEGSITPRTVRLTSPLFSPEYLDNQRRKLEDERRELKEELSSKMSLLDTNKENIEKFFKPKAAKKYENLILLANIDERIESNKTTIDNKNEELNLLNNYQDINDEFTWFIKFYQPSPLNMNEPLIESEQGLILDPSIPLIPYFGINAQNPKILNQPLSHTELHSIEKYIFEEAIKYLETQCAADEYLRIRDQETSVLPNNIALVNFFPRLKDATQNNNKGNKAKIKEEYKIEREKDSDEIHTHTIVLWKILDDKIMIIDPSNSSFSNFLKDILPAIILNRFEFLIEGNGIGLKNPQINIIKTIYKIDDNKGSIAKRDCSDIAVKIGFELNQKQANFEIKTPAECLSQSIEQISINTDKFPGGLKLFKPLQSSDLGVREEAKKLKDTVLGLKIQNKSFLEELDLTRFDSCVEPQEIITDIRELTELLGTLSNGDIL